MGYLKIAIEWAIDLANIYSVCASLQRELFGDLEGERCIMPVARFILSLL